MDGAPLATAHYIAKISATNSAALNTRATPAMFMKLGSSSSDYDTFYLFGSDTCIAANITSNHRNVTYETLTP